MREIEEIAIKRGQVYGMRCSGTNYLDALINKNFPDLAMGAAYLGNSKIFGWKHGDVGTLTYFDNEGKLCDVEMMPLDWARSRDTILFVIHRNPISWLRSLNRTPHQAPEAFGLDFKDFIRNPFRSFYCDPPGSDSDPDESVRLKQVKSKNMIESYDSVFEMRATKLKIFESFRYRFQNVVYINLETLEQDPERYLREVAESYKLRMNDKFEDVTTYKGGSAPFKKAKYKRVSGRDLQYVLSSLAWEEESKVGYTMRVGAKLLAIQPRLLTDFESLLNIFPYRQYYKNGHLIKPPTGLTSMPEAYRPEVMQGASG